MLEGMLLGSVLDPVRHGPDRSLRRPECDPAGQKALIKALDAEASVLGSGLGKNLLPAAKPSALDSYLQMVDTGRIQNELTTDAVQPSQLSEGQR